VVQPNQVTRPGEPAPQGVRAAPAQPAAALPAATQPVQTDANGAAIVSPQSVTQPGAVAPSVAPEIAAAPVAPGPAAVPAAAAPAPRVAASSSQMTYAEMFRDVALQYDLDWRLLAAQAYIESGFDSLALGADGDMGLMQVLPGTWREWAPAVGANDPFDAYSSALVAAVYHDYLRSQLGKRGLPQAQWMLVGYNWGIDRLGTFLDEGGTWEQLPPVRREYAEEILRIARTIP
jgi:soluble lytic murein transglycosylase-like protein